MKINCYNILGSGGSQDTNLNFFAPSRRFACLLIAALPFCFAPLVIGSGITAETSDASTQTQPPADITGSIDVPPETPPESNLRIQVEGNRRWCVRMREPIWPRTRVKRPRGRRPRRVMSISTMAYTYYVYAEADPEEEEIEDEESHADTASEAESEPPETEESTAQEDNESNQPTVYGANAPHLRPALREDGGMPDGSFLISEYSIIRPLKNRRRPQRQRQRTPRKPGDLLVTWDNSRSCSTFPTHIEASLPPGRYSLQANFDVLSRGQGWVHSHIARLEGVEIEEGRVTEVAMQVSTDGYVEVKPHGRVAIFLPRPARASETPDPGEDEPSVPTDEHTAETAPDDSSPPDRD